MTDRRTLRDRGFTLTEVLIVVTLMGLLSAAIAAVFTVVVRTLPPTEARADDARSLLGISTWLPADVSSTPEKPEATAGGNWDKESRPTGCDVSGAGNIGENVLWLSWSESLGGSPNTYRSSYRLVDGDETARLVRVSCVNGGTATVINVTAGLPLFVMDPVTSLPTNPVTVKWKTSDEGTIVGVEFEITTRDGDTLRVDASSRNPATTLSAIPTAVTTTTESTTPITSDPDDETPITSDPDDETPTSSSTTTTSTTVPCSASLESVLPNPVANTGSGQGGGANQVGPLVQDVTVRVTRSGDCSELVLKYTRVVDGGGASGDDLIEQVRTFGDSIEITLRATSTERWQKGDRPLVLFDAEKGLIFDTRILEVT